MVRPVRPTLLSLSLLLALLGCDRKASEPNAQAAAEPDVNVEVEAEAEAPAPPAEPPTYLVVPWGSRLHTAPSHGSLKLNLTTMDRPDFSDELKAEAGTGALFRVTGVADEAGQWWKLETLPEGSGTPAPLDGLEFYKLTVYVPAGLGEAGEPPQPASAHVVPGVEHPIRDQGGLYRAAKELYRVDPGTMVFWPDGKIAGEVREAHGYQGKGEDRTIEGVLATCFPVRYGYDGSTELCFERSEVHAPGAP